MADQLQLRGGTTAQHAAFTGALREVTVDTDKDTLVVHDGAVAGGYPLLRQDLNNLPAGTIDNADINASAAIALTKLGTGALPTTITVATANIVDGTIVNADISASAAIVDTKLATISTASKVSNSATTATSSNTASAIVARDGSGNFTAGTVTADLTGTASGNARLVRGTAVTSTSGTSIDFTSIPSWAKKITVMFYAVSTTGTSPLQIQIGDSGGVETTSYLGSSSFVSGANSCGLGAYTTGFVVLGNLAGATRTGLLTLTNVATTVWVASGTFDEPSAVAAGTTQGYKILSDVLDRVRITTVGGTDTFDSGIVNIIYEG
jgi:hypothetical protein